MFGSEQVMFFTEMPSLGSFENTLLPRISLSLQEPVISMPLWFESRVFLTTCVYFEFCIFIPSPVAIMANSKNPEAAKVFVNYVLSQEGQATLVELGSFIPVRPDVAPPEGAPALDKIDKLPTDWKSVQEERQNTKDKWTELFGD